MKNLPLRPDGRQRPTGRTSAAVSIVAAAWLAAVVAAVFALFDYSNTPGRSGGPPACWPAESRVRRDAGQHTLVMFAHPRCPCTRASLGELERLLARIPERLSAHVVFLKPAGTAEDWVKTGLWRTASMIPGVTVHCDEEGAEARRFCSETSGHTLLYGPDGTLEFHGGITLSRGHRGDNPGSDAIAALLRHKRTDQSRTPVFGCALFEARCRKGGTACKE